jgi:hypothetical protein
MFWNNNARLGGSDISASFDNKLAIHGSNIAVGSTSVQWDRLARDGCVPGEVGDLSGVCRRCGASTFSLNPYNTTCDPCPQNADCTGGMDVTPHKGFWHSGINSSFIHVCPQQSSCGDAGNCTEVRCISIALPNTSCSARLTIATAWYIPPIWVLRIRMALMPYSHARVSKPSAS